MTDKDNLFDKNDRADTLQCQSKVDFVPCAATRYAQRKYGKTIINNEA
ncbi:hypothetical protein [Pontibacterium sinense]|nr:hypothetical protein [Pontibacterium sinense]